MDPFQDIYRKDSVAPPPRRRRKRLLPGSSESRELARPLVPGMPGEQPRGASPLDLNKGNIPQIESWHGSSTPGRERRHRKHKHHHERSTSKVLWFVLGGAIILYAAILFGSILLRTRKPQIETGKGTPAVKNSINGVTGVTENVTDDVADRVDHLITYWRTLPGVIRESHSLAGKGRIIEAEQKLQRALEATPFSAEFKIELAQIYSQQKKISQARDLLLEALEAKPNDTEAQLMLSSILETQMNYAGALAVAKWVLETDSTSIKANQIVANCYQNTDQKKFAVPFLRKITILEPENTAAQNKLAVAYTQTGEYEKAVDLFNTLLENNATDSITYYNLAVCYANQTKAQQAVATLTQAITVFGREFVLAWMQSPDFDPIRLDPLFTGLLHQESSAVESAAEVQSATNPGTYSPLYPLRQESTSTP